jgi:hypothetical protein
MRAASHAGGAQERVPVGEEDLRLSGGLALSF